MEAFCKLSGIASQIYITEKGLEQVNREIKGLFTPWSPPIWPRNQIGYMVGIEFYLDE
jgi:hypothetical protein